MKHKLPILGISIFIFLIIGRLFCGVYIHDEFADRIFFFKHKPTWKWKFYSPQGMSDTKFEELTPDQQIEQKYFDEYVTQQGLSR